MLCMTIVTRLEKCLLATDSRDNHLTCFTDVLNSAMVPGISPSQVEILSMVTHFEKVID